MQHNKEDLEVVDNETKVYDLENELERADEPSRTPSQSDETDLMHLQSHNPQNQDQQHSSNPPHGAKCLSSTDPNLVSTIPRFGEDVNYFFQL